MFPTPDICCLFGIAGTVDADSEHHHPLESSGSLHKSMFEIDFLWSMASLHHTCRIQDTCTSCRTTTPRSLDMPVGPSRADLRLAGVNPSVSPNCCAERAATIFSVPYIEHTQGTDMLRTPISSCPYAPVLLQANFSRIRRRSP